MAVTSKELEIQLERVRKLESNVAFQFSIIAKLIDARTLALLSDTDLNLTAYRILKTVETFERISIADLSRHMVLDNAQVSRTATDLGKRGLVEFPSDPKSKRRKLVALSADGEQLMAKLAARFDARRAGLEEALGEEDLATLHGVFAKLTGFFSE